MLAIVGVLVFYLLARDLFGNAAAAICTFLWVTSPMVIAYVSYPLGHGPEITFTLLAFYATVRWARTGRMRWAFPAGLCAGFMPLIRPTAVLEWPASGGPRSAGQSGDCARCLPGGCSRSPPCGRGTWPPWVP